MLEEESASDSEEFSKFTGDLLPESGDTKPKVRRNSVGASNIDIADEIEELLSQGALSKIDADNLLQRHRSVDENSKAIGVTRSKRHGPVKPLLKVAPLSEDGFPSNWSRCVSKHSVFTLIELKKGESEFDTIESDLVEAGIKVEKIERLQNQRQLERFKSEMKDVKCHRSNDFDMNICYLYHGTNGDKMRLCEENLDQRLSRMGHYGRGIYFSDNPVKCAQYTKASDDSSKRPYILRCRVVLGDIKVYPNKEYDTELRREPEKENYDGGWRYYDSVKGCPVDYNEYVVYENRRAMIEYIITFSAESTTSLGWSDSITRQDDFSHGDSSEDDSEETSDDAVEISEDCAVLDSIENTGDDHLQRISEVREAVRRKRREEEGVEYQPPSEEQAQKDNELWLRLQELHCGEPVKQTAKPQTDQYNEELYIEDTGFEASDTEDTNPASRYDGSRHSFDKNINTTPVAQVLSLNISEFMQVTDVDNSRIAKRYLKRANMDVNLAISLYYEDM